MLKKNHQENLNFLKKKRINKDQTKENEILINSIVNNIQNTKKEVKLIVETNENNSNNLNICPEEIIKDSNKVEKIKYSELPVSDIFRPTTEQFKNPLQFFDSLLEKKDSISGIIRVIPPIEWRGNYKFLFEKFYRKKFLEKDSKLETRIQNINKLFLGNVKLFCLKIFYFFNKIKMHKIQNFEFTKKFNFAEYKNQSDILLKHFQKINKNELKDSTDTDKIEKLFWEICHGDKDEKTFYAADIPFMKYFSKKDITDMNTYSENIEENWTLQNVNLLENSLFQFLKFEEKSNISGLTIPWLYFGMIFSTFCWHVEDLFLYSLNFMHYGSPKIWYSIPVNEKFKMEEFLKKKQQEINSNNKNLIDKLTLLIDPQELLDNNIKVNRTVQHPGEIIITLPNSYHAGFSTGFNISEAVNFSVKFFF